MRDMVGAKWRKATRSGGSGGNCVEVAGNLDGVVGIRDSKDVTGPVLAVDPSAWTSFLTGVKTGRLI
ncbi:hypothetical protein GCM10027290_67780 [Micromonospora sonneratiae]|uniref:DUF397 domain-containing protein n=1 Tax=Micromonospora sonneratiae TaxID=1184706 RepID=A0ABW3YCW4_9ACTN